MKKLIFLFTVSAILCACPDNREVFNYEYSITNNSGKNILLVPYINGNLSLDDSITLQINEKLIENFTSGNLGGAYNMTNLFKVSNVSHVAIVFDNSKINIFSVNSAQCLDCPVIANNSFPIIYNENNRNLFNNNFNNDVIETYTITPEDYQNATDCGGNCY